MRGGRCLKKNHEVLLVTQMKLAETKEHLPTQDSDGGLIKRISRLERDQKLVQTCIRNSVGSKQTGRAVERPGEQFISSHKLAQQFLKNYVYSTVQHSYKHLEWNRNLQTSLLSILPLVMQTLFCSHWL